MEKIMLSFLILVLGSECFAQASATAMVSAEIIDECALIKEAGYECEKLSPTDRSRIVDSMLHVKAMRVVMKKMADLSYANNYDKSGKPLNTIVALSEEQQRYGQVYGKIDPSVFGDLCKLFYRKPFQKVKNVHLHPSKNGINWHY
jgi:hypothetical protein